MNQTQSQNLSFYLNSAQPTLISTSQAPSTYILANDIFSVGYGGSSYYLNGYISEIIIYDRTIKNSEITDIQNYLSKKYAIKLN
jgi:hypothetical protein